jgi:hypothetical protein
MSADTLTIPTTNEEQDALAAEHAEFWEFRVFAGALLQDRDALASKWGDHELRMAWGERREFDGSSVMPLITRELDWVKRQVALVNRLFEPASTEAAFGPTGEPGNPDRIRDLARRVMSVYEAMMDWAGALRNASVPGAFDDVVDATASLADAAVRQMHDWVDGVAEQTAKLPEAAADGTPENPAKVTITLTLSVGQEDQDRLDRTLEELPSKLATD